MAIVDRVRPGGRAGFGLDLRGPRPEPAPRRRRTPHVLVVDADDDVAARVRDALRDVATVTVVRDAYQALDHLRGSDIDLLLLEIFLPGASGFELLRRLGTRHPRRVVAMTHSTGVSRFAPEFHIDEVLPKPPAPERLRAALVAAAERRPAPALMGPSLSA